MSQTEQSNPAPAGRGSTSIPILLAVGFALATALGAVLSGAGTGTLQEAVRVLISGQPSQAQIAQHQQAMAVGRLESNLQRAIGQIEMLKSRVAAERNDTALQQRLAQIDVDLARLRMLAHNTRTNLDAMLEREPWRRQADEQNSAGARASLEVDALRLSLHEQDRQHNGQMTDLTLRVDRVEQLIQGRELTGTVTSRHEPATRPIKKARKQARSLKANRHKPVASRRCADPGGCALESWSP
jgi:hypothetical protein